MEDIFDLAIIGGGPAGYNSAERAAQNGLKAVVFETNRLGGVCLNEGCIPTKTMLHTAKLLDNARDANKYGLIIPEASFDYPAIYNRKNKVIDTLVNGVTMRLKKHQVTVVNQKANITGKSNGNINVEAGGKNYQARNLMIATGAAPFIPPIPGLQRKNILTSKEILDLQEAPESLVVIGGGYIGLEFGSFYRSLGTEVTVIETLDEITPGMDKEIAAHLRKDLIKRGITIHLQTKVVEMQGKKVIAEKNGERLEIEASEVLVSVGRRPNVEGFGLENLGVLVENGAIKTNDKLQTNIPNVFAAGDVNGKSLLAHTAYREGEVVVNQLAGRQDRMRYHAIPGVIYTNPEVASVGITEVQAQKSGMDYEVKKLPMAYSGRFIAENEGKQGHCKIIVNKKYNQIVGIHMIGGVCSEMIYGAAQMIESEFRLQDAEEVIFPHPTVSEVIKETIFAFKD